MRSGEVTCAKKQSIEMYQLMFEAGTYVADWIVERYESSAKIIIVVGTGNNGGDGYVAAKLLAEKNYRVAVASISPDKTLQGDAEVARQAWLKSGGHIYDASQQTFNDCDLIADALLGTGLKGNVSANYAKLIENINSSNTPVLSVDIPSGIHADTGVTQGTAIAAFTTITFVAIKPGLVTGNGKMHTGELELAPLSIEACFQELCTPVSQLVGYQCFDPLPNRKLNSHKGDNGKLLCIGGNKGMSGAIGLSAEAALRTGAGLIKVYCHQNSISSIVQSRPEIMATDQNLHQLLHWADCIVLGPGLGQDSWSRETFNQVLSFLIHEDKPIVMDADGLNLLSQHQRKLKLKNIIITPHSAEAARLLENTVEEVEAQRYASAVRLFERYHAHCVLKGAGTIVRNTSGMYVCADGNPGMSTAGMGDVLAGVLGALLAQGLSASDASLYGTCLHSASADLAAKSHGQRGMIASDLFEYLRKCVN